MTPLGPETREEIERLEAEVVDDEWQYDRVTDSIVAEPDLLGRRSYIGSMPILEGTFSVALRNNTRALLDDSERCGELEAGLRGVLDVMSEPNPMPHHPMVGVTKQLQRIRRIIETTLADKKETPT